MTISELFQQKQQRVLNVYCTAGYPQLNDTLEVMQSLQGNGADIIELGMPYSDPLADGPIIQQSSSKALQNGMTMQILFEQLRSMHETIQVPVVLMGYMNTVLQYGFERFCKNAAAIGISGLILPDLPQFEFENQYGPIIKKYGLDFIFLVTPETSDERIRELDALSSGFLYAVSSSSTTGSDQQPVDISAYLGRLKSLGLKNPVLVGFGIKDKKGFDKASSLAAGAIIGSAYIEVLGRENNIQEATRRFLSGILS